MARIKASFHPSDFRVPRCLRLAAAILVAVAVSGGGADGLQRPRCQRRPIHYRRLELRAGRPQENLDGNGRHKAMTVTNGIIGLGSARRFHGLQLLPPLDTTPARPA